MEQNSNKRASVEAMHKKLSEMKEQGIKVARLTPGEKSLADLKSLRKAVTAHCWECMGGEHFRECTSACAGMCCREVLSPWT